MHEAEYVDIIIASYEIFYLWKLLINIIFIPLVNLELTLLYGDNMGMIIIATNPDGDKILRTRHIDICYYITREVLVNDMLKLRYI